MPQPIPWCHATLTQRFLITLVWSHTTLTQLFPINLASSHTLQNPSRKNPSNPKQWPNALTYPHPSATYTAVPRSSNTSFLYNLYLEPHTTASSSTLHLATHLTLIHKTLIKSPKSVKSPMNVNDPLHAETHPTCSPYNLHHYWTHPTKAHWMSNNSNTTRGTLWGQSVSKGRE